MTPLRVKVWALRVLAIASLVLLCAWAGSGAPAFGFAVAWGPNGLFLFAFTRGYLHLPRFLEPVKPIEPMVYRWVGVGFIKRIVETREWPLLVGFEPPPKPKNRQELLYRADLSAKGAEICHAATFILASAVAVYYLGDGRTSDAAWIFVFNLLLNGYPVMLQRVHRWRIQRVRAGMNDGRV